MPAAKKKPAEPDTHPDMERTAPEHLGGDDKLGKDSGVTRIDQPSKRTHGYFARVYLHGRTLTKFFADRLYDSPEACHEAAKAHREAVMRAAEGATETPSTLGLLYITRMDYARARGWWVRVSLEGGKLASRLFSDSEFGGAPQAQTAAQLWRDAVVEHYGLRDRASSRKPRVRTTTGARLVHIAAAQAQAAKVAAAAQKAAGANGKGKKAKPAAR